MRKLKCGACSSPIKAGWKYCSGCGETIEWVTSDSASGRKASFTTYCGYAAVIALIIAPMIGIYSERNADLLSLLKNQAVLSWNEDTSSETLLSAGKYTPDQAIVTATGSCTIWIYPNEKLANEALDEFINLNAKFSAAWSGVEDGTNKGVILWSLENNSFCSEEAAHYLEWKLEE